MTPLEPGSQQSPTMAPSRCPDAASSLRSSPRAAILGLVLLALLLAAVPYVIAWQRQTADLRFMGLLAGIDDNNVYLALMRQAREGSWLFVNNFTPDASRPKLFNALYLALGRLARYSGLSLIAVHQLFAVFSTFLFAGVTFRFFSATFRDSRFSVAGTALALFASGFFGLTDLLRFLFGADLYSVDSWLTELSAFHCLLVYPHFLFASALLVLTVSGLCRALTELRSGPALQAAATGTLLLFSHAFDVANAVGAAALFGLVLLLRDGRELAAKRIALLSIVLAPLAAGMAINQLVLRSEPAWAEAVGRLSFPAPGPGQLILGIGLTGILALVFVVWGARGSSRPLDPARSDRVLFCRCWVVATLFLLYQPWISWQFHLLNGIQVPLSLLALDGLRRRAIVGRRAMRWLSGFVRERLSLPAGAAASLLLVILCAVTCLSTPAHVLFYSRAANRGDSPRYLSRSDLEVLEWLESRAQPTDVILAAPATAHYIPRLTGSKVVAGEDMLTHDYSDRAERVRRFYGPEGDEERRALLREFGVRWVFVGQVEQRLGPWDPSTLSELELAHRNRRSAVFSVSPH